MPKRMMYRLVWVPSALALVAIIAFLPAHQAGLAEAGQMTTFTSADGKLSLQRPANWEPHEAASHDVSSEVQFRPGGDAFMRVTLDLAGSLMADIDRSSGSLPEGLGGVTGGQSAEPTKTPLQKAHERTADEIDSDLEDFKAGSTTELQVAGVQALATDFTYRKAGDIGSTEHVGRFITAITTNSRIIVVYHCPNDKGVRSTVMPVFEKMVASIRTGEGGQR